MKITKNLQNIIRKGLPIVLATTMAGTMVSCSEHEEKKPTIEKNTKVITVVDNDECVTYDPTSKLELAKYGVELSKDEDFNVHEYEYVVDITKTCTGRESSDKKLYLYESYDLKSISSEKVDEEEGIAEYWWRAFLPSPVANYIMCEKQSITIPDCYLHYFSEIANGGSKDDLAIYDKMKWFYSEKILAADGFNELKLVYSRVEVKEDVSDFSNYDYYTIDSKNLNVGDVMESYALYLLHNEKEIPIGYIQTGVGSNCENVQEKIYGNLPTVITTIEQSGIADTPITLSEEEFELLSSSFGNCEINENGVVVESSIRKSEKQLILNDIKK